MSKFIGIDLGTTYSAMARLNEIGKPEVITNSENENMTPSVVWFDSDTTGKVVVGSSAKNSYALEPDRVVAEIKREMGNPDYSISFDGVEYLPAQISAFILKKLKEDAEQQSKIDDDAQYVITVPAHFDEPRRTATMNAAKIIGINVTGIINEPTAAALFYATNNEINGKVLVYDLGGGTFDATLMDVSGKDINIISSEGDHHLGGVDFDKALSKIIAEKYEKDKGSPLYNDEVRVSDHYTFIEAIKKELSIKDRIRNILPRVNYKFEVSRSEFEEAISAYVYKSEMCVESILSEQNLSPKDIDKVLLVGGSCRIPYVQKRLKEMFGFEPTMEVNVDQAIALGAAIQAGLKALDSKNTDVPPSVASSLNDVNLIDVTNHSYGTIVVGVDEDAQRQVLVNSIILKKNTPLPCKNTETYHTLSDNQDSVDISITQGEGEDLEWINVVHKEEMSLPSGRPAGRPVDVTYKYNTNQIMSCLFVDVESGQELILDLHANDKGGFDAKKIEESRETLDSFTIE